MAKRRPGQPDRQFNPDADLASQFGFGCLVLFFAFLLLAAVLWWVWMW